MRGGGGGGEGGNCEDKRGGTVREIKRNARRQKRWVNRPCNQYVDETMAYGVRVALVVQQLLLVKQGISTTSAVC